MRVRTSAASILIAGALIVGLTACGGATAKKGADTATHPAASAAAQHHLTSGEFMDVVGAAELEAGSCQLAIDWNGALSMTMIGSMTFGNGDARPAMDVTLDLPQRKATVKVVGGLAYVALDPATKGKFIRFDPSDTANTNARFAKSLAGMDPVKQIDDLRGAVTAVEYVGEDNVRGVIAAHYAVTVDPAKITGETAKTLSPALKGKDITYDYWLDPKNRAVQIKTRIVVGGEHLSMLATFHAWGEAPPIVAPTAAELTTLKAAGLGG